MSASMDDLVMTDSIATPYQKPKTKKNWLWTYLIDLVCAARDATGITDNR